MGKLTIYSGPLSMFGAKVQIAALEKRLDFDLVMVPYDSQQGYSPKHPEVLRINPKRQVPVLVEGDLEIFDSTQIFEYFEHLRAEPTLWPSGVGERARTRLLEHRSDEVYFPHVIRLMGFAPTSEDQAAVVSRLAAAAYYDLMERQLDGNDWLGGSYSYANIAFYMAALFGERMGAPFTEAHPRLKAWRERMGERPAVRKVAGAMGRFLAGQGRTLPAFLEKLT